MKLAISNIGWTEEQDSAAYSLMKDYGYSGLEIAPTRIFPANPYDCSEEARKWAEEMYERHGFTIASMQSIWYGRQEKLFASEEDRAALLDYTKRAIDFAAAAGCKNLVFGCPRNRAVPEDRRPEEIDGIAVSFFKELGDYALSRDTALSMEANPVIYNTNYINDTASALELIKKVDSAGFLLNLDLGTMIENGETTDILAGNVGLINHVHISEPGLAAIRERQLHKELFALLKKENYRKFVSIEMQKQENMRAVENSLKYVRSIA